MLRSIAGLALILSVVNFGCATDGRSGKKGWSLDADLAGACCCAMPCPCAFREKPTLGHCEANVLFEVRSGNYQGVRLNGLTFVMSWRGGGWAKFYVDPSATDEQLAAVPKLVMAAAGPMFNKVKVLGAERGEITIVREGDKVGFSVASAKLEMTTVAGADGSPIRLENLTHPLTPYRIQYQSNALSHDDGERKFDHKKTSGYLSRYRGSGTD